MKKIVNALAIALALAGLSASVQAADYKPRIIRFGYGLAEDSNQGRAVKFFADDLAKRTGGKMKAKGFANASLGSDTQMQNALIGGAQEMMVGSTATLVGIVKDFGVYDLPFLFNNEKEADAVLDGPFGQKLIGKLQDKGLVGLVYWENGFRNLTNTKHPVAKLEDLQGIKLRVMQNPVYIDMFNSFGANAVPLPFSELFTALETKTVDGQENPVNTIQSSKFYEVQKYLSLTKHVYSPWIVLVSKKWWDGLSADEKKAIQESAAASRDFERKDSREAATKAVDFLKQKGMQVTVVSDAELGRMREKAKPAFDKFASEGGADLIKELQGEIAKVRK
ncbi:TRAP transporter substrate-binding protein [Noviherbaspirillum sp. Root189]|jgi:TRAP-type transport system periplasmic protein|uniref:TRAP transporter substrate-binding protein n=1 Tax=Noviherbaspirillum sp. Root189 TaxID=1736487 RepID=UPI00070C60FA|nr:TRAP transporter substrate-binding protein [Noviherbaspirillum sp. Root189]KRB83969.1 ABC transporter substrate-binding protein [Noviherbaspirillum sp. Root189]